MFLVVEVVVAVHTRALTVLSDAGHMATDLIALVLATLAVTVAAGSAATARRTYGLYRLETLAALANGLLLCGVAIYVAIEACKRFDNPVSVPGPPMIAVAIVGFIVNAVSFGLLRAGSRTSLAVRSAATEVLADALGSMAVLIAGVVVTFTSAHWIDPVLALLLAGFMAPRAAMVVWHALRVLVQAAPGHLDVTAISARLARLDHVQDVHDLHVWTLTSGMEVATVHLGVDPGTDIPRVLGHARALLQDEFGIQHATLQVEPTMANACHAVRW